MAGEDIRQARTADRHEIHTAMGVEIMVFGRDEGILHALGDGVDRYENPALIGQFRHQTVIGSIDAADSRWLIGAQTVHAGQIRHQFGIGRPAQNPGPGDPYQSHTGDDR